MRLFFLAVSIMLSVLSYSVGAEIQVHNGTSTPIKFFFKLVGSEASRGGLVTIPGGTTIYNQDDLLFAKDGLTSKTEVSIWARLQKPLADAPVDPDGFTHVKTLHLDRWILNGDNAGMSNRCFKVTYKIVENKASYEIANFYHTSTVSCS